MSETTIEDGPRQPINENELPANLKNLWDKAVRALRMQNFDYVIQLLMPIVKEQPRFLDGRRALRKCQIQVRTDSGKRKGGFLSTGAGMAAGLKIKPLITKDPLAAMRALEDELAKEPTSKALNEWLYEAAVEANLPDVAAFALETLVSAYPKETSFLKQLAQHYMSNGRSDKAVEMYTKVTALDPSDLEAVRGVTRASADASMKKNRMEEGGEKRDDEERRRLELLGRQHLTPEQIEKQLSEFLPQYNEDNTNISVVKRIATLYEKKEDWETAKSYYEWAHHLSKGDTALERKVDELREKLRDIEFATMEREIAENPNAPDVDAKKARLAELRQERLEQKIAYARDQVEKNPTEPALRFLLATHLFDAGNPSDAIPELQRAKNNPHVRTRALLLLGRCFAHKGMNDMAINQFREAEKDLSGMDDHKKQLLYERALIHEKIGQRDEYLQALKEIYEVDYGYRDVAGRVEASYQEDSENQEDSDKS